jgi:hypothetical protein
MSPHSSNATSSALSSSTSSPVYNETSTPPNAAEVSVGVVRGKQHMSWHDDDGEGEDLDDEGDARQMVEELEASS